MSVSYLGRTEPTSRRRLGADFDLLAKWYEAAMTIQSHRSFPLSQLSPTDQEKLFRQTCELRFERGPDNTVRLETIDTGKERTIDPEITAMLYSPNYKRSCDRDMEELNALEDASPEGSYIQATTLKKAIQAGYDMDMAKIMAGVAFMDHVDAAKSTVHKRWKTERLERIAKDRVFASPKTTLDALTHESQVDYAPPDAPGADIPLFSNAPGAERAEQFKHTQSDIRVTDANNIHCQIIPDAAYPTKYVDKSANPSPEFGSETTEDTVSSGSPKSPYGQSSPSLQSATASINTVASPPIKTFDGASLDSYPYGNSQYPGGASQSIYGHLGSGLAQAFLDGTFVAPSGFHAAVAFNAAAAAQVTPLYIANYMNAAQGGGAALGGAGLSAQYGSYVGSTTSQFASFGSFSPLQPVPETPGVDSHFLSENPKPRTFPPAKVQPWPGMKCYDVPTQANSDIVAPEYWTTKADKAQYLQHKIHDLTFQDAKLRADPAAGIIARNPVHIFVDLSNIIIGFYDCLKMKRGIPIQKRVHTPAFSFENFDAMLSRGRKVEKKVVAGSLGSTSKRRPEYMIQAEELGYEMNILRRVQKPVSPTFRKRQRGKSDLESATSGPETSGDDFIGPTKNGEQGVDELLHLKILQSAIDTQDYGTIVLATGDAAHAEYSDGFKRNVERVLGFGWNIELYGWSRGISSAWRDPEFTSHWGSQVRIIELDDYCEELFDATIDSLQYK